MNAGTNSNTFTTTALTNGDVVTVTMTSNDPCANPVTANSNPITITATAVIPSVTIAASTTSICVGASVTFTATPVNGGAAPTYQWQINGANVAGQTASAFTSATLNNNDVVSVIMTSNDPCANPTTANSNNVTVTATTTATPTVNVTQPDCVVATGTITVAAPLGAGFTYSIDGITYTNTTGVFAAVAPGNYNVTVRNASGCTSAATPVTINAQPLTPAAPTVNVTQPNCSVATGTITITAPLGAGLSYSIDGIIYTNTTGIFNNVAAGNYNVTVRNAAGCTSAAAPVTINTPATAPAAPTVNVTQPTCAVATGTITVTAPLGAGLTYSIDGTNFQASTIFNNVAPGNYTITVQNAAGCSSAATPVTINAQPLTPAAPTVNVTQPNCSVATGTITITAPLGAGLTYSIDGITYTNTTGVFTTVAAGNYSVTVRNTDGCTSNATPVTINNPATAPPVPTVTSTQPTCAVATATITVTAPLGAGLTYSIDGIAYTNTTGIFNNVTPGNYNVTVRNASGCTSAATPVTINAQPLTPAAPTVNVTQPNCSVATGTITITAPLGAGLSYSIDGIIYTNTDGIFNNVAAGNYNVTVRNAAGCTSAAAPVTINTPATAPAAPTVNVTQPTCAVATGTITVTAPLGAGLTYSIDGTNFQASTIFNNVAPGNYTITVQNAAGCSSAATPVTINAQPSTPAAPTVNVTQPNCSVATGTITITAPLGAGLTYSIDGITYTNTTGVFTTVAAGNYSVTVRNTDGCTSNATPVTINNPATAPPVPTVTSTQPTCAVATATITVTAPLGAGLTYSIDGIAYTNTTGIFNNVTPGNYNVTVRNAAGCISAATPVTINAQPLTPAAPTVNVTQPNCSGATGTITITAPLGAGLTYSIDGVTYTNTNGIFNNVAAGNYNITVRNAAGCTSPATPVTINTPATAPATPTVNLVQPTCAVATGTITVTAPLGTGLTYSIDGINFQASAVFNNVAPGNYNVTVVNAAGCSSAATPVTINTQPLTPAAPTVNVTQPNCTVATGTITITAPLGAGLTYSIDGITYTNTDGIFNNVAAGNYNVTVRNAAGCTSAAAPVTINTPATAPAVPTVTVTQPTCAVATGTITVTAPIGAGLTYSIDGTNFQASTIFNNVAPGNYTITVQNAAGCSSAATPITVNAQPLTPTAPATNATQPNCTVATGTITVTAPLGAGLTYSIDGITYTNTTGVFTGVAPGNYSVTVRNAAGCTSPATPLTINAQPATPAAPTATVTAQPTCAIATGTITVTAPLGAGLTYSIDGVTYTNTTGVFTAVAPGNYNITVRNAAGCTSAATPLTINAQPATPAAPTATATQPNCAVATGTITVTAPLGAGLTYSIDGITYTNTTGVFTGVVPGNYNVTVRNAAGCTSAATPLTINAQPATPAAPTATVTQPNCTVATGTITVTVPLGAGLTYSIDGVTYTNTTGVFTGVVPGNYSVTVRNAAGCSSLSTPLTVNAQPTTVIPAVSIVASSTSICAGGSVTFTATPVNGGAAPTYQWQIDGVNAGTNSNTFTTTALTNGDVVTVTMTSNDPCANPVTANSNPITITATAVIPSVTIAASTTSICVGASVTFTATPVNGGAAPTYQWQINGANVAGQTASAFTSATLNNNDVVSVIMTSNDPCANPTTANSNNVTVTATTTATPTVNVTQPDCVVATGTITVAAPLGAGFTYSIDGITYTNTTGVFAAVAPGNYNVTVRNASGCTSAATPVTINAQPLTPAAPTVNVTQPNCSVATGTITITAPLGAGLSYSIDGIIYTNTTGIFNNVAAGNYNVTVRNAAGCTSAAAPVTINTPATAPAAPTVNVTQPTCAVATGTITVTAPLGAGLTYSIDGTNFQASTIFNNVAPGNYTITVQNAAGCSSAATPVTINTQPATPAAPTVNVTQPNCSVATGTITVTAPLGAGLTYSIDGITYTNTTGVFAAVAPGNYSVTVRNTDGCTSNATPVTINAQPAAPATPAATVTVQPDCVVATGTITVTAPLGPGLTYSIDDVNYTNTTGVFTNVTAGNYNVTVRNAAGCISSATTVTVNNQPPALTPIVNVAASSSSICSGGSVTFTATPVNGGTAPTYQWQVNGVNNGTNSNIFTTTTLVNGDIVTVIMTSNDPCVNPATATSSPITITATSVTPSVAIVASTSSICAGGSVTFTATPVNGGAAPAYQWQVNGVNTGNNNNIFTSTTLVNGDVVTVIMTSNDPCASPVTATSNLITIVTTTVTPSVSIAASSTSICSGSSVTFTATSVNGGTAPAYQWQINGGNVTGATNATFTSTTLNNNDVVTVVMTSNDPCANPGTATSNPINITATSATPSVTIAASTTSICLGSSVTFTATPVNGGTAPAYQWLVNGFNIVGATNATFTSTTLNNNDIVTVIMTSNDPCANPVTATSNAVTITATSVTPSVTIAASTTSICSGGSVTFTATPVNGGTAPTYQWQINGTNYR